MAIAAKCPECGKAYNVDDRAAGKSVKCRTCGTVFKVIAPASTEEEDPFAAMNDLANLERTTSSPPERSAPPPLRSRPASVAPPVPGPGPAAKVMSSARPVPHSPFLGDSAARSISLLLLLGLLVGSVWINYDIIQLAFERAALPEGLASRVYAMVTLSLLWSLFCFFVVMAPLLMLCCGLASRWTRGQMPDSPYVRAAGTMAIPFVGLLGAALLMVRGQKEAAITVALVIVPVMLLGLKELMGLKWSTFGVAAALLLVAMPVAAVVLGMATGKVKQAIALMVGLDQESVVKYAREHPDEVKAAREQRYASQSGGAGLGSPPSAQSGFPSSPSRAFTPAPPPPPDPLVGTAEPLLAKFEAAITNSSNMMREELKPLQAAYAAELAPLRPATYSPLWNRLNEKNAKLAELAALAPSREAPAELFVPPADRPLPISKVEESDLQPAGIAFKSLIVRPVKDAKVDLKAYAERNVTQRWLLSSSPPATLELTFTPLSDPKQQQPWIADRPLITQLAAQKNLFSVSIPPGGEVTSGKLNGVAWTRVLQRRSFSTSWVSGATYVGRLPDGWVIVRMKDDWSKEETLAKADKMVGALRVAKPGEPAVDAFSAAQLVERFSDVWDDPGEILAQLPADSVIPALQAYLKRGGEDARGRAKTLLTKLAGTGSVPTSPREAEAAKPMSVAAALELMKGTSTFDQRKAMLDLARMTPTDADRDSVASALEERVMSRDAFFVGKEAAAALSVWWRPRTATVLLPALDEKGDSSQREAAFKVLAKTKDKAAVFPMIRWIIKEPDKVVPALKEMGPVAEDEVLKLLRQKDAAVRTSAARILEVIGTKKSLAELSRSSKDPRDPGAAGAAKLAFDAVKGRNAPDAKP